MTLSLALGNISRRWVWGFDCQVPLNIWGTSNGECHAETAVSDSFCHTRTREGPAPLLPWVSLEEPACNPVPSPQHPLAAGGPACGPHLSTPGNLPVIPAAPHPARGSRGLGVPTSQSSRRPAQEEAGVSGCNSGRSRPPPGRRSRRPRPTPAVSTHRSLLCPPGLTPARARGWRHWTPRNRTRVSYIADRFFIN